MTEIRAFFIFIAAFCYTMKRSGMVCGHFFRCPAGTGKMAILDTIAAVRLLYHISRSNARRREGAGRMLERGGSRGRGTSAPSSFRGRAGAAWQTAHFGRTCYDKGRSVLFPDAPAHSSSGGPGLCWSTVTAFAGKICRLRRRLSHEPRRLRGGIRLDNRRRFRYTPPYQDGTSRAFARESAAAN